MATATTTQPDSKKALRHAAIVIVAGVLATTLAQTQVLGRIPLQNLLKNQLHVDPERQRRVLLLGRTGLVLQALRRHLYRRVPGLRKPPQELHPGSRHPGDAVVVCPDLHAPPIQRAAHRLHHHQCVHGDRQHRGGRLHGGDRASHLRLGTPDGHPRIRAAGHFYHRRPHRRISGQHRLRMDRRGLRRDHVPADSGHHPVPA